MTNPVNQYLYAKEELFQYFRCEQEYYVNDLRHMYWKIHERETFSIVSYAEDQSFKKNKTDVIIIKRDDEPLIYKTPEYTMIIGIQCVKVGLVFKNANEL